MLLLQPVGPSLHMTTFIQETREPPRTGKEQTLLTKITVFYNVTKIQFFKIFSEANRFGERNFFRITLNSIEKEPEK